MSERKKGIRMKTFLNNVLGAVLIIAVIISIRVYWIAPVVVQGHSMDSTLHTGQHLFIQKTSKVKKDDIVVFNPPYDDTEEYIKRVIATEGDTVQVENDILYVNGKVVEEPYLNEQKKKLDEGESFTGDFPELTVWENEIFVMGDNRLNSNDSRAFGTVSTDRIKGVVIGK